MMLHARGQCASGQAAESDEVVAENGLVLEGTFSRLATTDVVLDDRDDVLRQPDELVLRDSGR